MRSAGERARWARPQARGPRAAHRHAGRTSPPQRAFLAAAQDLQEGERARLACAAMAAEAEELRGQVYQAEARLQAQLAAAGAPPRPLPLLSTPSAHGMARR